MRRKLFSKYRCYFNLIWIIIKWILIFSIFCRNILITIGCNIAWYYQWFFRSKLWIDNSLECFYRSQRFENKMMCIVLIICNMGDGVCHWGRFSVGFCNFLFHLSMLYILSHFNFFSKITSYDHWYWRIIFFHFTWLNVLKIVFDKEDILQKNIKRSRYMWPFLACIDLLEKKSFR